MEIFITVWFLLLFAIFSGAVANSKNRSVLGWFLIGMLLGPFGLLVAFLDQIEPDVPSTKKNASPQRIKFENYYQNKVKNAKAMTESKTKNPEPNS